MKMAPVANPTDNVTDNLKQLARDSRQTITELEARVAEIATQIEEEPDDYFLLGSADLHAQVYYAPLYNLPKKAVAKIIREPEHTLLREIRERFLVNIGPNGFLREVCNSIRRSNAHDGDLFFISVHGAGRVGEVCCYDAHGDHREPDALVTRTIELLPEIGPELRKFIQGLQAGLGDRRRTFFLIRAEPRFRASMRSTELDIMQIGVAFVKSETLAPNQVATLQRLSQISSFATISLLYEKERYYEKAIRQAVRGSIIKFGERSDIANQVKTLKELQTDLRWHVPTVRAADPVLDNSVVTGGDVDKSNSKEFAWYSMPWFVIPSLMDVISLTEGFERYEIAALIRSGFTHVQRNYWTEDIQLDSPRMRPSLLVALVLAIKSAETAFTNITYQREAILKGEPVKFARGIDVFSTSHLKRLLPVLDPILEHKRFSIKLNWDKKTIANAEVLDPIEQLSSLVNTIGTIDAQEPIHRLRMRGRGTLHGDAHFGNLLVDASIPEDPLIISIDPSIIDVHQIKSQIGDETLHALEHYNRTDLDDEIKAVSKDPLYDIAKFMLSTSCCYGLIYRNGLVVRPSGNKQPVFHLGMNDEVGPEKLKDAGGISGAQIVRIAPKVPSGAWDNHCVAARRTLHEYRTLLNRHQGNLSTDTFLEAVNIGLTRLWFLTVRHAFSIAGKLFPVKMSEATAMYLLATLFVNRGLPTIQAVFADKNLLKLEATATTLTNLFLWDTKVSA